MPGKNNSTDADKRARILLDSNEDDHPLHDWPTALVQTLISWTLCFEALECEFRVFLRILHNHFYFMMSNAGYLNDHLDEVVGDVEGILGAMEADCFYIWDIYSQILETSTLTEEDNDLLMERLGEFRQHRDEVNDCMNTIFNANIEPSIPFKNGPLVSPINVFCLNESFFRFEDQDET